jgi:hypothetical protein
MIRAAATQNVADEHGTAPNHIFSYVYQIRARDVPRRLVGF